MSGTNGTNGKQTRNACGCAVQGETPLMLQLALLCLQREGVRLQSLPACNGDACAWYRAVAQCLQRGECWGAVLFCADGEVGCCVANKLVGVRAAQVSTVAQAERAIFNLGANLLLVEAARRTFFECKEILRLASQAAPCCPAEVTCMLAELESR